MNPIYGKNLLQSEILTNFVSTQKHMKTLLSLLLILMAFGMVKAQTTGHLHYQLEFSTDNPDLEIIMPLVEGSYMDFYLVRNLHAGRELD